jgi:hypothetical protein
LAYFWFMDHGTPSTFHITRLHGDIHIGIKTLSVLAVSVPVPVINRVFLSLEVFSGPAKIKVGIPLSTKTA